MPGKFSTGAAALEITGECPCGNYGRFRASDSNSNWLPADRRSCSIGISTVHKYLKRAEAAGLSWPLPADWDEARVDAALFPRREATIAEKNPARTPPDFAAIHEQLRGNKYVTLQLLWEEYRQASPDGYRYSRFCELYQRWRSKLDVVLRQEHKAGEKMFVDWAGATIPVSDRHTGQAWPAQLFVAAPGTSSYTWAEATRDQQIGIVVAGARACVLARIDVYPTDIV